jgi:hypothetical protein
VSAQVAVPGAEAPDRSECSASLRAPAARRQSRIRQHPGTVVAPSGSSVVPSNSAVVPSGSLYRPERFSPSS